jgi:hypothetical protein
MREDINRRVYLTFSARIDARCRGDGQLCALCAARAGDVTREALTKRELGT